MKVAKSRCLRQQNWLPSRAGRVRIALIVLALATLGRSQAICATCAAFPGASYGVGSAPLSVALGDVNGETATLLDNGKVLVAGGANSSGTLSTAELCWP